MNYFFDLLSCGKSHQDSTSALGLPSFCLPNQKNQHIENNNKRRNSYKPKSLLINIKPETSIGFRSKENLPKTKFMILNKIFQEEENNVDWGDLIGVIGANKSQLLKFGKNKQCLEIGLNQDIPFLSVLRPNSLDSLVVFWKNLECEFTLRDILCTHQRLTIILQDFNQIQAILKASQEELLKVLGQFSLYQSSGRIYYNLKFFENKYVLEFLDGSKFEEYWLKMIQKEIGIHLQLDMCSKLMEKITLRDFLDFQKKQNCIYRKIQNYIHEIQRTTTESKMASLLQKKLLIPEEEGSTSTSEHLKSIKWTKNSNDETQMISCFFNDKKLENSSEYQESIMDPNLQIFYFNNQADQEECNKAEQNSKNSCQSGKRTKSEDYNFPFEQPDQFLDDEFFEKY